ncbi:selenocysteine-specific translation elongation factor, partial [bacterium]|nr:selenocysteine-specific translation elongation factor [bacterium]
MFVLGTAGHVDHGKSSFLRAITGMEPDRLPEEKSRGLTINLGFLWSDFPNVGRVGFVDVPGHHRFLGNMISGMGDLSAFLLVVACDDGWMPQTEEHLQILKSFEIKRGLCVLSKRDLVDTKRAGEIQEEVSRRVGAALGFTPQTVFFIHNDSGSALAARAEIANLLKTLQAPRQRKLPRLWVDRVFSPKGMGVVVTGTLSEGALKKGDSLFLWPEEKSPQIRSLQCYQVDVPMAEPVTRVAIQLSQLDKKSISRGSLLSGSPIIEGSRADAKMTSLQKPLKRNLKAKFYLGTLEEECLVIPLSKEDSSSLRLQFSQAVPLRFGDCFVLRTFGEETLLGGGWVVDPQARSKTHGLAHRRVSEATKTLESFLKYESETEGTLSPLTLAARSGFSTAEIEAALQQQVFAKLSEDLFIQKQQWDSAKETLLAELHKQQTLTRKRLLAVLFRDKQELLEAVLKEGLRQKLWEGTIDEITLSRAGSPLGLEEKKLLEFVSSPPAIWAIPEIISKHHSKKAVFELLKRGEIVLLKNELIISRTFFDLLER